MINYTKEQQEAIDYFDSDLLISASAGSGKTQVLLEKVLKLILNGINLDEILMVTFTNLAASEMKSKLENMILEKIEENPSDNLFDSLHKINTCDISTLHSFCQKLVREYYYILNIEPNFEIKDEAFLSYLKSSALENTIKFYLDKGDEEFIKISNLFVYKREYNLFKEEILKFYEFLTSKLNKYDFCDEMIKSNYNTNLNENILFTNFRVFVSKKINFFKDELTKIINDAKQMNSEKLVQLSSDFYGKICEDFKNNESFIKFLKNKIEFPQIRIKNNAEFEEIELKEQLQNLSKKIKKFLTTLNEIFDINAIDDLKNDIKSSEKILIKFVEIIKTFETHYNKLKRLNNCLDFNDLEILTLKLFENKNILNEISSKYKFIFVDEYQDTNLVQEEILKLLSNKSKRIMVGDIKQSIYAFRQCNPKIFSDKLERFSNNKDGKVINLNKNFRSNYNILDFSNSIFSNLMRKENCDYDYKKNGKFICGREDSKLIDNVEILCIDKNTDNYENAENIMVLNTINNLLNQQIIENGVERKLTYSDIAIISRKRNESNLKLCQMLDDFKIPYSIKYYEKIYKSFEVKLVLAYLNILNNLDNDISLYSVLKNIYQFSTNDLIAIKTTNLKNDLLNYVEKNELFNKIQIFLNDYNYFSQIKSEKNIKSLVEEIIDKLNIEIILIKSFGKISSEKLKIFVNNIPKDLCNLSEFILYCKEIEDKKFEVRKITSENCITIDTFHSTKGLEFNAVIIYGAGESIFAKNRSNLIFNAKFGIGIYKFDEENKIKSPNVIYSIINQLNKQEEFNEEVRLSYVAFTRAKNYMTIIGKEKTSNLNQEKNTINFLDFNSYLSLIYSSEFKNENIKFSLINCENNIFNIKSTNEISHEEKFELNLDVYKNIFEKQYQFKNSTLIQLKNSVSALSEEDKFIYNISNFKLTDMDDEDYIEIGNSYHKTFEQLPFNLKSEQEVRNKIINLIENKMLPENVYQYIDDNKILQANKIITSLIDKNDKVYKEKVFMIYIPYNYIKNNTIQDKILVQGIIDIFIEKENEIILIDYKTSRLNDVNLIKKYDVQLKLYEKALKEKYKDKKIKKYIYSIFLDKLINIV